MNFEKKVIAAGFENTFGAYTYTSRQKYGIASPIIATLDLINICKFIIITPEHISIYLCENISSHESYPRLKLDI